MDTHKVIDVTAGVIWRKDRFLVTQRRSDDPTIPGLWEFPGGKIEDNETAEQCLARELKEELEIEVSVGKLILINEHAYPTEIIRLHFYDVEFVKGEMKLNDHADAKWISMDEVALFQFAPADVPILKKLLRPRD